MLFPGVDIHTRSRYYFLPPLIREGDLETLDAGFGNGALAYAAYLKGNRVLGVSNSKREVQATTLLFDYMGISRERAEFRYMNIYNLRNLQRSYDQIICSETLEHITRDAEVIGIFSDLLKPGGQLLLCCPYALHPAHALGRRNVPENGDHVRDGYTLESYRALLEAAGLRITKSVGLGSPLLCWVDGRVRDMRVRFGDFCSLPLFCAFLPLSWLDYINPRVPFSLAVVAEKL